MRTSTKGWDEPMKLGFMAALLGGLGLAACAVPVESEPTRSTGPDVTGSQQALASPLAPFSVVAPFDLSLSELPHDVVLRGGKAYVVLNPIGRIVEVDSSGVVTPYATLPVPYPFAASTNAIVFGADGSAYVSVGTFSVDVASGIYRVPPGGGAAALWASSSSMPFPNGLAFLGEELLVADSLASAVFSVDPQGHVTTWAEDPLLEGTPSCAGATPPYVFGASGLAVGDPHHVVVTNADSALVVQIPVHHGAAGTPTALVGPDCSLLAGADHVVQYGGSFYVAVNRLDTILRITPWASVSQVATGGDLDFPSSVAIGRFGQELGVLATNFAIIPTGATPTGPSLVFARKL